MDRNFHIDDFERLLREKSEEFRMYPSKRIWHSIYNNVHPSRKWPSVAMSISLMSAIILLGYLNTTKPNHDFIKLSKNISPKNLYRNLDGAGLTAKVGTEPRSFTINNKGMAGTLVVELRTIIPVTKEAKVSVQNNTSTLPKPATDIDTRNNNINTPNLNIYDNTKSSKLIINTSAQNKTQRSISADAALRYNPHPNNISDAFLSQSPVSKSPDSEPFATEVNDITFSMDSASSTILVAQKNILPYLKENINVEEKTWIDNYALYNKPVTHRWANKSSWQVYLTPSVVYRLLYSDQSFNNNLNTTPFAIAPVNQDINYTVIQKPSIGLELGGTFKYRLSKTVQLKTGLQINYTRYNSNAFQNTHPVLAKLTMHDYSSNLSYEENRTTPYSNKSGLEAIKLHNETFQISLPVGADLKLLGNEHLQWNVGLTIQPTYVITGKSYLISADRRYYVKDNSMLNKWNLNAGFETFLSYKANGLTYQIGPQFRTQFLSTNNKRFAVEERLIGFGLKLGITKALK